MSGIQHHSTIHAGDSYIIFSSSVDPWQFMKAVDAKVCQGSYKGALEISYITKASNFGSLWNAGILEGQESVLILGPWVGNVEGHRPATLYFLDGVTLPVNLGYFTKVTEHEARQQDAWTKRNGEYYICKHYRPSIPH